MKPKGGDGMNEKMEQIRRAVKAGKTDGGRRAGKRWKTKWNGS